MSHNKTTVNSKKADSNSSISLSVQDVVGDTASSGETIRGTAAGGYEFGAAASLNPLAEYFYASSTQTAGSQGVTSYGYITQYIDNRAGTNTNVELGIESTGYGGEGVAYGGGGTRVHSQLIVDEGTYFVEYYPTPKWSSSGSSVLQYVQGNSGSADVKGNRAYCYTNSPSRNFYARVISTSNNNYVWPKILSNTNQRIGTPTSTPCQAMIAYKI